MQLVGVMLCIVATLATGPAWAASRTITLSVPDMDCAVCPITVKAALSRVDGVIKAAASLERREAIVIYDDAKTDVEALTRATANAGYPSKAKK